VPGYPRPLISGQFILDRLFHLVCQRAAEFASLLIPEQDFRSIVFPSDIGVINLLPFLFNLGEVRICILAERVNIGLAEITCPRG
jgi:hypothetical protein